MAALSSSDLTRIKRLNVSKNYLSNGQVQVKDLSSSQVSGCNGTICSSKRTDMNFVGKLKTCRETSKIIDFKASQAADFVLVRQYSGATGATGMGSGFGRQLIITKICNTNGDCTSILQPKVVTRF
jgi:hypothetical protein